MKKSIAIFFSLILLFNAGGYRVLLSALQSKADKKLEIRIDNNEYDEAQLVEIKVPLNMPYQSRQTDFERHYGEITIDGKAYTYVKKKIDGDVLILKCIRNEQKQALKKTADDLVKTNSGQDQENNSKKQNLSFLKIFGTDYDNNNQSATYSALIIIKSKLPGSYTASLSAGMYNIPFQPPKACPSV